MAGDPRSRTMTKDSGLALPRGSAAQAASGIEIEGLLAYRHLEARQSPQGRHEGIEGSQNASRVALASQGHPAADDEDLPAEGGKDPGPGAGRRPWTRRPWASPGSIRAHRVRWPVKRPSPIPESGKTSRPSRKALQHPVPVGGRPEGVIIVPTGGKVAVIC